MKQWGQRSKRGVLEYKDYGCRHIIPKNEDKRLASADWLHHCCIAYCVLLHTVLWLNVLWKQVPSNSNITATGSSCPSHTNTRLWLNVYARLAVVCWHVNVSCLIAVSTLWHVRCPLLIGFPIRHVAVKFLPDDHVVVGSVVLPAASSCRELLQLGSWSVSPLYSPLS